MEPEQQVPLGRMYRQYAKADAIQQEEYALAARLGSSDLATSPIPRLRPADWLDRRLGEIWMARPSSGP